MSRYPGLAQAETYRQQYFARCAFRQRANRLGRKDGGIVEDRMAAAALETGGNGIAGRVKEEQHLSLALQTTRNRFLRIQQMFGNLP